MKSKANSIEEYLQEVPAKRKDALIKLRELCHHHLTEHEESMKYSMPSYERNDQVEVAFASQKQHICVYILKHEVMLNNSDKLQGINHGKGCIRFSNPEKIDFELISHLLQETLESDAEIC